MLQCFLEVGPPHSPDNIWHNTCSCYKEELGASKRATVPLQVLREPWGFGIREWPA